MNRLQKLFQRKSKNILSVYTTAGYPYSYSTGEVIESLSAQGVDMIEIGVPFSDPMADGPVIQKSSSIALNNGTSLRSVLEDIAKVRNRVLEVPLVLMSYLNPIIQFGIKELFVEAKKAGVDAMIIPDLPFNEYMSEFKHLAGEAGIPVVMLITPETSAERIKLIDENSNGFIYMVSSASTTGTRDNFDSSKAYFEKINNMNLQNPRLVGFGISNRKTFEAACEYSSGAIVGSLFIKSLEKSPNDISMAVNNLLQALSDV